MHVLNQIQYCYTDLCTVTETVDQQQMIPYRMYVQYN
jgi:hypothetical protein